MQSMRLWNLSAHAPIRWKNDLKIFFYRSCYCVSHIVCLINLRNPQTSGLIVCRIFDIIWFEYLRTIFYFWLAIIRKGRRLLFKLIYKICFILPGMEYDFIITIVKTWRRDFLHRVLNFHLYAWICVICALICP